MDMKEPDWSRMKELPMREFQRAINSSIPGGMVRTFEIWEPPMWGYLPPPPLRKMPRKRWYKVTLGCDLVDSLGDENCRDERYKVYRETSDGVVGESVQIDRRT